MYQDGGYGENWQPEGNNARRFDPYTRSCAILASLFAIGFVLIVIVVLSLIPIYISHKPSTTTNNNIQTSKISITNYNLQFQPPYESFNSQTILSDSNNRLSLQAALTSMLQKDSTTIGSVVEINAPTSQSNHRRRQLSNSSSITFPLNIISNTSCSSNKCLNQFHTNIIHLLSNSNKTTSFVRYQQSNATQIYWLYYQLPATIQSDASLVYIDLKTITTLLDTLMSVDKTENQPFIENSTSTVTT